MQITQSAAQRATVIVMHYSKLPFCVFMHQYLGRGGLTCCCHCKHQLNLLHDLCKTRFAHIGNHFLSAALFSSFCPTFSSFSSVQPLLAVMTRENTVPVVAQQVARQGTVPSPERPASGNRWPRNTHSCTKRLVCQSNNPRSLSNMLSRQPRRAQVAEGGQQPGVVWACSVPTSPQEPHFVDRSSR